MAAARHLQMPSAASPADTMGESGASALADGVLDDQLLEEDLDEVLQTLLQPRRGGSAGGTQGSGLELPPAGAPRWSSAKPTIAAAAPLLVTTGERSCWGAVLMGSNERCTPSFEIGKGHFKNKFCPNCRTAGVPLPASRVRAIASSQHREWANDMHLGLWSENRDGGQIMHYRLVNQTHKCHGPWIVILRAPPPAGTLWAQMPSRWVRDGWCTLLVSKGTLIPSEPRERSPWLRPAEKAATAVALAATAGLGPVPPVVDARQPVPHKRSRAGPSQEHSTSESESETGSHQGGAVAADADDGGGPEGVGGTPREITTLRYLHDRLATMVIDQFQRPAPELTNLGIDEAQLGAFIALLQPVRASSELLRRDVAAASSGGTPRTPSRSGPAAFGWGAAGVLKRDSDRTLDAADLFASLQEDSGGSGRMSTADGSLAYYDARIGEFWPSAVEVAAVRAKLSLSLPSVISTGELHVSNRAMEDRDLCLLLAELRRLSPPAPALEAAAADIAGAGEAARAAGGSGGAGASGPGSQRPLPALTRLDLSSNFLTVEGVRCLSQLLVVCGGSLQTLDLSSNRIGDAGLDALAFGLLRSGVLAFLVHLRLNFCRITCTGVRPLAAAFASAGIPALETLDLNANSIGDDGCVALAGTLLSQPKPSALRVLALGAPWGGNAIGDAGAVALAHALAAGSTPQLRSLALANNRIGEQGALALAHPIAGGKLPKLELLSVVANHIPINALRTIRAATKAAMAIAISEPQLGMLAMDVPMHA